MKEKLKNRFEPGVLIPYIIVISLLIYVLSVGVKTSSQVMRTFDGDLQRNLSQTQSFLDGAPLADPNYLGEKIWYNPLIPALTALISSVSGVSPDIVNLRAGAFLNILTPLFFFLLCLFAFGRIAAVASVFAMLFLITAELPIYFSATYSPILYALHLAPFLFFISLYSFIRAVDATGKKYYILTGLLLGITFLAHTAPAVILGLVILIKTLVDIRYAPKNADERNKRRKSIVGFLIAMAISFTVSLPFLYSILFNYKMKIINPVPMDFTEEILNLDNFKVFLSAAAPHWIPGILILIGLVILIKKRKESTAYNISFIFFIVVACLMLYNYIRQMLVSVYLPLIVPSLHYVVYLTIAESVLFGLGAAFAIEKSAKSVIFLIRKVKSVKWNIKKAELNAGLIILVLAVVIGFMLTASNYPNREDFGQLRQPKVTAPMNPAYDRLYKWVLENTAPEDVFLNDNKTPDYMLMAGRKFVVNPGGEQFSNPYVDYDIRQKDRNLMFQALEDKGYSVFLKKAEEYKIKWIVSDANSFSDYWHQPEFLSRVYSIRGTAVYSLDYQALQKACRANPLPSEHPFKVLEGYYEDVTVFDLHPRNFTFFENESLKKTMPGWRWVFTGKGPQRYVIIFRYLNRITGNKVIITSRKALMGLIGSEEMKALGNKRLLFCGFRKPEGKLRLRRALPQKVIISPEESRIWDVLRAKGMQINKFSDGESSAKRFTEDDEAFLRYIYAFIFNAEWRQKHLDQWLVMLKNGKTKRLDVYHTLLKQASEIEY